MHKITTPNNEVYFVKTSSYTKALKAVTTTPGKYTIERYNSYDMRSIIVNYKGELTPLPEAAKLMSNLEVIKL
jgi:hypothetical protein